MYDDNPTQTDGCSIDPEFDMEFMNGCTIRNKEDKDPVQLAILGR
jgi:hypothetical protein